MKAVLEWLTGVRGALSLGFCWACEGITLADWALPNSGQLATWLSSWGAAFAADPVYIGLAIGFGLPLRRVIVEAGQKFLCLFPKWRFGSKVDGIGHVVEILRNRREGYYTDEIRSYRAMLPEVEQAVSTLRMSLKEDGVDIPRVNLADDAEARAMHEYMAGLKGCAERNDLRQARNLELYPPEPVPSPPAHKLNNRGGDLDDEVPF